MILGAVIEQLRTVCAGPPLEGRVAGAADFVRGLQNYNATMRLPAAYVIPLTQESPGFQVMIGAIQTIIKTIGVVVEFDATNDRRGQHPAMDFDMMEAALLKALLMWPPAQCRTPNYQGFYFAGGRFLDLDRARLFYQWEFALPFQLAQEDAWEPPSEPLDQLDLRVHLSPLAAHPDPAIRRILNLQPVTVWDDPNNETLWDDGRTHWPL